jgi:hypothetical protein
MDNIKSKRGREKITHDGHMFCFDKVSGDGTKYFWRCDKRDSHRCKARLHTDAVSSEVIAVINDHTDGSNAGGVEAARIVSVMKRRAEDSQEIPSVIVNNALQGASLAVRGQMPKKDAAKLMIRRTRNLVNVAPPQPVDRGSIILPDRYQTYEPVDGQSEQFLLFDTGVGDADRILAFGRESNGTWSHQMRKIYVDGTFRIAPNLFQQVYVIMSERGGFVFPVIYALLPGKQEATYQRLFEGIKGVWPNFNPTSISTDFELAALNAMGHVFPAAQKFGCLFHLVQNMRKKVAHEGLLATYNNDPEFSLAARMIVALAFVPPNSLEVAFDALSVSTPQRLLPVLNWFEDNYLGRLTRRGRQRAVFPHDIWSVYDRTVAGDDRTNNHVEAAHRRMQSELGMDHPTLWKFVDGIRKVQNGCDQDYEQFVRGEQPPHKRVKYVRADARIRDIVMNFDERTVNEFLRGIAHNFLMD